MFKIALPVAAVLLTGLASPLWAAEATATIRGDEPAGVVSRHLYGHFVEHLGRCVYDGLWVGPESGVPNEGGVRRDVLQAFRELRVPNLRWPGGCFADDYHWRDGIGPPESRPARVNMHWGRVVETNAFGTHEFFDLCEKLGAEPYLAGNVGSGTPRELRDWLEYITYDGDSELANLRRANGRDKPWKLKYLGVGNENWGCGGDMRSEYYADLFRRYAAFCRGFGGPDLVRIACGPSGSDVAWNQAVMQNAHRQMQGYSIHQYTLDAPWGDKQPATGFDEKRWHGMLCASLEMRRVIQEAEDAMDPVDPQQRIGLFVDEWGSWYRAEPGTPEYALYQQNTLRDALLAAITLHVFHEHNDRVVMANIAQAVNVLQSMVLTDGPKMVLTPTYHVFRMFRDHHDGTRLPIDLQTPSYTLDGRSMPGLSVAATRDKRGRVCLSVANAHASEACTLACELRGVDASSVSGSLLTAAAIDAHNTFDNPERVRPQAFDGAVLAEGTLRLEAPPRSVIVLTLAP